MADAGRRGGALAVVGVAMVAGVAMVVAGVVFIGRVLFGILWNYSWFICARFVRHHVQLRERAAVHREWPEPVS